MSIASAIATKQQQVANAYTSLSAKGATMPATQNLTNLANTIDSLSVGSDWNNIKVENMYGTNPNSCTPSLPQNETLTINLPEDAIRRSYMCAGLYTSNAYSGHESCDVVINYNATTEQQSYYKGCFNGMFYRNKDLHSIVFNGEKWNGSKQGVGAVYHFQDFIRGSSAVSATINIKIIAGDDFYWGFGQTQTLVNLYFPILEELGQQYYTMNGMFQQSQNLHVLTLPKLVRFMPGYSWLSSAYFTELHFPVNMKYTVENSNNYANRWNNNYTDTTSTKLVISYDQPYTFRVYFSVATTGGSQFFPALMPAGTYTFVINNKTYTKVVSSSDRLTGINITAYDVIYGETYTWTASTTASSSLSETSGTITIGKGSNNINVTIPGTASGGGGGYF